jgi:hypothetical protein
MILPTIFPQNSFFPDEAAGIDHPGSTGTEASELNNNLKKRFVYLASQQRQVITFCTRLFRTV